MKELDHTPHTWEEVLDVALKNEKASHDLYDNLLLHTKVPLMRELLEKLRDQEALHVNMVEKMIADMHMGRG